MSDALADCYLRDVKSRFAAQKALAERAAAQIDDVQFFATLDGEGNSVALLMKHLGGNLRARWTDVFTTDGEKPDRDRDAEFEREPSDSRVSIVDGWSQGWEALQHTLEGLTAADLLRPVVIRGEPMLLLNALERGLVHAAQHAGQIVMLARHLAGTGWTTLSIAKGQSKAYSPPKAD